MFQACFIYLLFIYSSEFYLFIYIYLLKIFQEEAPIK